jgi:Tfp pilus assembly protein PilF
VTKPISGQTIVAMYMNNRAAETLAAGEANRAYWFARAALKADPTFTSAANTLAVIYWNLGHTALSEEALRFTLAREPGNVPALTNLLQVLDAEGRTAEAQSVAKELAEAQRYPPFYFYDRGMQALDAQDFADAARQFKKDLSRRPYDSQSHFGLAMAAMHLGDLPQARKELQVAIKNATTDDQRTLYAAKLRELKAS